MQREVEREKRRERLPANFGKPWTESEDRTLTSEFDAGLTMGEMARKHARTQSSIRLRLRSSGRSHRRLFHSSRRAPARAGATSS